MMKTTRRRLAEEWHRWFHISPEEFLKVFNQQIADCPYTTQEIARRLEIGRVTLNRYRKAAPSALLRRALIGSMHKMSQEYGNQGEQA